MCSGRQSRPHLFHVVRKVCTKSGHVSTIPPVVKNNSHHGISTIKSDYPKKAVLFITHDLDEAIAMSDRVVVMSAGPASHPLGSFPIAIPRPRNVAEIRTRADFNECYSAIWEVLREEVLKSYREHRAHVGTLAS